MLLMVFIVQSNLRRTYSIKIEFEHNCRNFKNFNASIWISFTNLGRILHVFEHGGKLLLRCNPTLSRTVVLASSKTICFRNSISNANDVLCNFLWINVFCPCWNLQHDTPRYISSLRFFSSFLIPPNHHFLTMFWSIQLRHTIRMRQQIKWASLSILHHFILFSAPKKYIVYWQNSLSYFISFHEIECDNFEWQIKFLQRINELFMKFFQFSRAHTNTTKQFR